MYFLRFWLRADRLAYELHILGRYCDDQVRWRIAPDKRSH